MTNSSSTSADALITTLHAPGQEHILDLVRNPLRLTMLCMTWDGSSLPETQAELYDRYLRKIYGWNRNLHELEDHAQRCGTTTTKLKQNLNRQLGELAKAALNLPQERFRLSQALVEQHLGEESDRTSLAYLALWLGWLNRVGRDGRGDGIFAFYHATFQEYFAALAVEDWDYFLPRNHVDRPVAGKRYRIFEKQWKQVILLWLGRRDIEGEEKEAFVRGLVKFNDGVRGCYRYQAYFLAAAGINEFKACSLAAKIVRQIVVWEFGYFNIEKQEWLTFLDPIKEGARKTIPKTIRRLAISELIEIIEDCPEEDTRRQAAESLGKIDPENADAITGLIEIIRTAENDEILMQAVWSLGEIGQGNTEAIAELIKIIRIPEDKYIRMQAASSLGKIDPGNADAIAELIKIIHTPGDEFTRNQAAESLGEIGQGNAEAIAGLAGLIETIRTTKDEVTRWLAAERLGEIDPGNADAIAGLIEIIRTSEHALTRKGATRGLEQTLTTAQQYAGVVSALKDCLSDDVYQNDFERFEASYQVIWNCAENLPYPDFYQAWHNPTTTPHPEVTEQTSHSGEQAFASPLTWAALQHLPMYCLNTDLLANETREGEIALTLSELIWEITCPDEAPPEPATPAELRRHLKTLKRRHILPHRALLFRSETVSTPTQPTPELIAFCQKLTGEIAIAFLTEEPLEAPLKGFPPNQPNLISAIETWLGEI